jgi:cytochrome c-type biogenesis protein
VACLHSRTCLRDSSLALYFRLHGSDSPFSLAGVGLLHGFLLLLVYGIGHCPLIVLDSTFTEVVQRYLNWNDGSIGVTIVKRVCGAIVILGGVYLIHTAA